MTRRTKTPWIASLLERHHVARLRYFFATRNIGSSAWRDYAVEQVNRSIVVIRRERSFARMQMCV